MPTFHDLKLALQAEEEAKCKERNEKGKSLSPEPQKNPVLVARERLEGVCHADHAKAYTMLENRAKQLLEEASREVYKLQRQSREVKDQEAESEFSLYQERKSFLGGTRKRIVGSIRVSDFHFVDQGDGNYALSWKGPKQYLDSRFTTAKGPALVERADGLAKILREVLEPLIIARRIQEGLAPVFEDVKSLLRFRDWFSNRDTCA